MKIGKLTTLNLSDQTLGDKYLQLPVGTISDRPSTPAEGMLRYNLDVGNIEGYSRGKWTGLLSVADFRIPGAQFPEDENVTIASLATLLRQFQRTIVGGFDVVGVGVEPPDDTSLELQNITEGNAGIDELSYITMVESGTVKGWMNEAGKGETFARADVDNGGETSSFQAIVDAYAMSGFDATDRHDYIFDYFANIYRYSYINGDYVWRGTTCSITPVWNLLDPWNDPDYGKFRVHLSLINSRSSSATAGGYTHADVDAGFGCIKWFVKMVRYRNFRLQNVPDLVPGGGSAPMPAIVDIIVDGADYNQLHLQNYLLRKYPTWAATPVTAYIHVKPTYAIYSRAAAIPALDLRGLPVGSTVYVKNEGHIIGSGGKGGDGGGFTLAGSNLVSQSPTDGGRGSDGLATDSQVTAYLDNTAGVIGAGGGAGGGGASAPVLPTHVGTYISRLGGGGGGAGGAEQLQISSGGYGAGLLEANPNGGVAMTQTDLLGAGGSPSVHRDNSGINLQGTSGAIGGELLVAELSGGSGGAGGSAGNQGSPGDSLITTSNITVVGWTATDDVSANQRLTFGTEDITMGNIPNFSNDHTQNDWAWFNTNVIPALNNDGGTNYQILPFNSKNAYETVSAVVQEIPLLYGFVIKSTVAGSAAATWTVSKTGDGNVYLPWTNSRGASSNSYPGGAGGGSGNSIVGEATLQYATIDVTGRTCTVTDKSTSGGSLLGPTVA
tara:strand:+ start:14349 stop:16514 length:2166 start_codon:yes stop_codon:yes gene_type:complete